MCRKLKGCGRRIDFCLRGFIMILNDAGIRSFASCCGHNKYHLTVVTMDADSLEFFDLVSGVRIPRVRRFYVRDGDGWFFIPEVEDYYKSLMR